MAGESPPVARETTLAVLLLKEPTRASTVASRCPVGAAPRSAKGCRACQRAVGRGLLVGAVALIAACGRAPDATPTPADLLVIVTATPGPERRPATPPPVTTTYEVREGDTLSAIAVRFGVAEEAILEANGLENPDRIMAGQVLRIPPPEP